MQHSADMRMGQTVDAVATNCSHLSQFESGFKARIFYYVLSIQCRKCERFREASGMESNDLFCNWGYTMEK